LALAPAWNCAVLEDKQSKSAFSVVGLTPHSETDIKTIRIQEPAIILTEANPQEDCARVRRIYFWILSALFDVTAE
jgi:hypothetical protein